jgi:UDP-GlcNAc:undecaprenyl-phosphate GlcNAc-1-phosphate transferase
VTAAAVALAGSLVGFLRFNFNPARIFLGDSGSMFLGFVLAVTSVRGSQKGPTAVAILVPLLVLGLPLVDTGLAVVRRLIRLGRKGRNKENGIRYMLGNLNQVFLPDRGHIHHRLIDLGLSQRGAVLALYVVGLLFACAAFALVLLKSLFIASLLLGVLILLMASFLLLVYLRIRRPGRIAENLNNKEHAAATAADPLASSTGRLQSR